MSEKELLDKIAAMLREAYPDAVSINMFVNHQEAAIEKKYCKKTKGISMRNLSGEWIK